MEQTGKRDSAIELVRVVAMFMIIFDHMLLPINLPCKSIISQFLNSGVYIFIILSFIYQKYMFEIKIVNNLATKVLRFCYKYAIM